MTHGNERRHVDRTADADRGRGDGRRDGGSAAWPRRVAAAACLLGTLAFAGAAGPAALSAQEAREAPGGEYEVERGDTLWDLADRFLDDPFLWQRIWKANQQDIQDPDLIYPGQDFAIPGRPAEAGRPAAGEEEAAEPERAEERRRAMEEAAGEPRAARDTAREAPPARESLFDTGRPTREISGGIAADERPALRPVSRGEALGAPFLAKGREIRPRARVTGPATAGDRRVRAWQGRTGDEVRVHLRQLEASTGDTLFAVHEGRTVGRLGKVVRPAGILRVEGVRNDTALTRLEQVFGLVREGIDVIRLPDSPAAPSATEFRPAERELTTTIVAEPQGGALLSGGRLVFLDRGSAGGVRPGDLFLAAPEGSSDAATAGVRLLVIRVRPGSSTARITYPGDGTVSMGATARLTRRLVGAGR